MIRSITEFVCACGDFSAGALAIQIDVGFGDALGTLAWKKVDYPAILEFPMPRLRAYHPATVVAEKLNAMVVLGVLNSRMKDFYDMHAILTHIAIDDSVLEAAICSTFQRRIVPLPYKLPVAFTSEFLEQENLIQWQAFLRRSVLTTFGLDLATVVADLRQRLWPILPRDEDLVNHFSFSIMVNSLVK